MREGNELDRLGHGERHLGGDAAEGQRAHAVLTADGKLTVTSATADIGTGTYTIMTQIAAEMLGLPLEDVTFQLGDSSLPEAPVEGGSFTAASVGSAIAVLRRRCARSCSGSPGRFDDSPLAGREADDVALRDGHIVLKSDPSRAVSIAEAMRQGEVDAIEEEASATPRTTTARAPATRTRRSSPR